MQVFRFTTLEGLEPYAEDLATGDLIWATSLTSRTSAHGRERA